MVEAEGVEVQFTADDKDFNARLDNLERRLERAKEKGKKGGKEAGSAFFGGFAGGVTGVIAGGAMQTGPVNAVMDLMTNVLGAALLPLIQKLLPFLKEAADFVTNPANNLPVRTAAGAALGSRFGVPGAVIGGLAASASDPEVNKNTMVGGNRPGTDAYSQYRNEKAAEVSYWDAFWGSKGDQTAYDYTVDLHEKRQRGENIPGYQNVFTGEDLALPPIPAQEPGRPYHPDFPPPNVGELHGPTVVNTG